MSGSDFPPGVDGQTFTKNGITWRYDGATQSWVNANQGGSFVATDNGVANQPTINQPVVMGVTDGSDAPAGAVGEKIESVVTNVTLGNGSTITATTISVTPGDWNITAFAMLNGTTPSVTYVGIAIALTAGNVMGGPFIAESARSIVSFAAPGGVNSLSIAPVPYNATVNTLLYLNAQAAVSAGLIGCSFVLTARRVR